MRPFSHTDFYSDAFDLAEVIARNQVTAIVRQCASNVQQAIDDLFTGLFGSHEKVNPRDRRAVLAALKVRTDSFPATMRLRLVVGGGGDAVGMTIEDVLRAGRAVREELRSTTFADPAPMPQGEADSETAVRPKLVLEHEDVLDSLVARFPHAVQSRDIKVTGMTVAKTKWRYLNDLRSAEFAHQPNGPRSWAATKKGCSWLRRRRTAIGQR